MKNALDRFVSAQDFVWDAVIGELSAGKKQTHWSWFIFPQIRGLGESALSQRYAIDSAQEADAYWHHSVLGPRLRECVEQMLKHEGRFSPEEVLGPVDAMKLRSCLTLFEKAIPGEPLFGEALDALYQGQRDPQTLKILAGNK